jgi:hypothetical protein
MRKTFLLLAGMALLAAALPAQPTTCDPNNGSWTTAAPFPLTVVRAWGQYFPDNGKFYVVGGRISDSAGSDLINPRQYDPATNTWSTMGAALPDNQENNMVGGVLDIGGTDYIVVVGGSAAGAATATDAVKLFDPVADTITEDMSDPWPGNASGAVLPGGSAVVDNKLYIFGGFNINIGMVDGVWQYDPNATAGSRWTQMTATLASQIGYIPTAQVGGLIYMAGGSSWDGVTINDTSVSEVYDPVADEMSLITSIPRVTAETKAVAQTDGTVWVLSGGRTNPPNPSTEVDVYDPIGDAWSLGPAMITARRNFATDVDPATGRIFATGGYDTTGTTLLNVNEIWTGCYVFVDGFESGNTSLWSQVQP